MANPLLDALTLLDELYDSYNDLRMEADRFAGHDRYHPQIVALKERIPCVTCDQPKDYHLHRPSAQCAGCNAPHDHHNYTPITE